MHRADERESHIANQFIELVQIVTRLRSDDGCPWDKVQTFETLKSCLLEEAYEVLDAVDAQDPLKLREELGDLLMQVAMYAQLAREAGLFSMGECISDISAKLVRRHPHVFGDVIAKTPEEVLKRWESIKSEDNGFKSVSDKIGKIPSALPALSRAAKVQKAAAMVGFDWDSPAGAVDKLIEETNEVQAAACSDRGALKEELGDLLFSAVNVARLSKIDAEDALRHATRKFEKRFAAVERRAAEEGRPLVEMSLGEMDEIWDSVKEQELRSGGF